MTTEQTAVKRTLVQVGEPDRVEIIPGLIFEDKIRIKTQRRLEKHFQLSMARIFPGQALVPDPEKKGETLIETWKGVDFEFLDNLIPLITIIGMQADETLTQEVVEDLFDNLSTPLDEVAANLSKFFEKMRDGAKSPSAETNSDEKNE